MKRRLVFQQAGTLVLLGLLAASGSSAREIPPLPPVQTGPELVREIYVPYPELLRLSKKDPSGIVMKLEEYRQLLELARRHSPEPVEVEDPPPVAALATRVRIEGEVHGLAATFRARIDIEVAAGGWVRCDLGPELPFLSRATLDGEPAWLIVDPSLPSGKKQAVAAPRQTLLLRGAGQHELVLEFSLPITAQEDSWTLAGPLPAGVASHLTLKIPERVVAESRPGFLRSRPATWAGESGEVEGTVLDLTAGSSEAFHLTWKLRRGAARNEAALEAVHDLTLRLDTDNPTFGWLLRANIHREKTDRLRVKIPANFRVLRGEGAQLHTFQVTAEEGEQILDILLQRPVEGIVTFVLEGLLDRPATVPGVPAGSAFRFDLGRPVLLGAVRDRGTLTLDAPAGDDLRVIESTGWTPRGVEQVARPGGTPPPLRAHDFHDVAARGVVDLLPASSRFEARATHRLILDETGGTIQSAFRIRVESGRLYRFALTVPGGLEWIGLAEGGTGRGLRFDPLAPSAADRVLEVELHDAARVGQDVIFTTVSRLERDASEVRDWSQLDFPIRLPGLAGASRERRALGIEVPTYLEGTLVDLAGWTPLPSAELAEHGLGSASTIATLEHARPGPDASLTVRLARRPFRGVYQAVIQALAHEEAWRLRVDVRLAVTGRPLEAMAIRLPVDPSVEIFHHVPGFKEMEPSGQPGERIIRFQKPWLGERRFRFELDLADPGAADGLPIPLFELSPAPDEDGGAGTFDPARFVVLGSRGGVELEISPGESLLPVDLDSLPAFSQFFRQGRTIRSYRLLEDRVAVSPGTVRRVVHDRIRERLLGSGISNLELETTVGRDGVIRTRSSFVLRYSLIQHLRVSPGEGEEVRSVRIDGEPERPVRSSDGEGAGDLLVPLPPRSYATIELVTERQADPLDGLGELELVGPAFPDLPVGKVDWAVHVPPELDVNLVSPRVDSLVARPTLTFFETFVKPLLTGRSPSWTVLGDTPGSSTGIVGPSIPSSLGSPGNTFQKVQMEELPLQQTAALEDNQLVSIQQQAKTRERPKVATLHVPPDGIRREIHKLGGDPRVTLVFREDDASSFRRRALFLLTLVGFVVLTLRARWQELAVYLLGGLALATTIPEAFHFDSTLSWTPVGEALVLGLVVLAIYLALAWTVRGLVALARRRRAAEAALGSLLLVSLLAGGVGSLRAQEPAVLIPYSPSDLEIPGNPAREQVWVPYTTFIELWNRAFPTERVTVTEEPAELLLANARYELELEEETFRIRGEIAVKVFTENWTSLPLPVSGAQLSRIEVNGKPRGVTYRDGIPTIAFRGKGDHVLTLILEGPLELGPGEARLSTTLVTARAGHLGGTLPEGLELDPRSSSGGKPLVVREASGDRPRRLDTALGSDGQLTLQWRSRVLKARAPQQVSALSDATFSLDLDGYDVRFRKRIRVEGAPLDYARYLVRGDWQVLEVEGTGVGEWNLRETPGAGGNVTRELEVFFTRRGSSFDLVITGFAPLADTEAEPAGLELVGAQRTEGFIGLIHHPLRRFPPTVLDGLERATRQDVRQTLGLSEDQVSAYDRVYRYFGNYADERLRSVPVETEGSVESEMIAWITRERVAIAARVTFTTPASSGPLEYRLPLESGWSVRSVSGSTLRDWQVVPVPTGLELRVHLTRRAGPGTRLEWQIEGPSLDREALEAGQTVAVTLPRFQALTSLRQVETWAIATPEGLELIQLPGTTFLPVPAERAPSWRSPGEGLEFRMGFRSVRPDAVLQLGVRPLQPRLRSISTSFFRVASTHIDVNCRVRVQVTRSGIQTLRLRLPTGGRLIQAGLPGSPSRQEIVENGVAREVLLRLPTPTRGELLAHLSYRIDRPAGNTNVELRGPEVLDVDARRDFVAVIESPVRQYQVVSSAGYTPVSIEELPDRPLEGLPGSSAGIFRAFVVVNRAQPLVIAEDIPRPGAEEEVIEMVEIDTVLAADGSNWTVASYQVRNRTRQFLEIRLPPRHELWRVTVDGEPVPVSQRDADPDGILVPVERVLDTDLSLQVRVVYTLPRVDTSGRSVTFVPLAPELPGDPSILQTLWRVHVPEGFALRDVEGNLTEIIEQARYGEKVKGLVQQIKRIQSASENATRRGRQRALGNLLLLEQELRDNVVQIRENSLSPESGGRQDRVQGEALQKQLAETNSNATLGLRVQEELEQLRENAAAEEAGQLDPVDQEFDDARGFSRNIWGDGRTSGSTRPVGGELPGEELPPLALPALKALPGQAVEARPAGELPDLGLARAGDSPVLFDLDPGIEIIVPRGGQVHTFRRFQGNPELELNLAHPARGGGVAAWLGLLVTLGILGWYGRRRVRELV